MNLQRVGVTPEWNVRGGAAARLAALGAIGTAVVASWAFAMSQAVNPLPAPNEASLRLVSFLGQLVGVGTADPAYGEMGSWLTVARLATDTIIMSVLAMGIACAAVVLTLPYASRWLAISDPSAGSRWPAQVVHVVVRGIHMLMRAVPEVVWALLVVFAVRPGVVAGALALALHEFGVLGRLTSDVTDNMDRNALHALRSAGARRWQLLGYGVLPQVVPQLLGFMLYRWEVVMRATVVVGFITGAGLGYQLRLDLSFRRWTDLALVLVTYAALVWAAEAIAALLRRIAR